MQEQHDSPGIFAHGAIGHAISEDFNAEEDGIRHGTLTA